MSKRARLGKGTKGQSSSSSVPMIKERVLNLGVFDNDAHQMNYNTILTRSIHSRTIIDWAFLVEQGLERGFFKSIHYDPFSRPQWRNLFLINKPVYRELTREFFATFEFGSFTSRTNPRHV
ncbi:hypothetical protein Tco_1014061, partial [Tanacetum coccineum]